MLSGIVVQGSLEQTKFLITGSLPNDVTITQEIIIKDTAFNINYEERKHDLSVTGTVVLNMKNEFIKVKGNFFCCFVFQLQIKFK